MNDTNEHPDTVEPVIVPDVIVTGFAVEAMASGVKVSGWDDTQMPGEGSTERRIVVRFAITGETAREFVEQLRRALRQGASEH